MPDQNEDMELVVDFSEEVSFEPIPKGWYGVTVTDAKGGESQAGNRKVSLQFSLDYACDPEADESAIENRNLFDDLVLEGKGTWKTRQLLEAVFGEAQTRLRTSELINASLEAYVTQKVWREEDGGDGETRSRISKYRAASVSAEEQASLEDMFK